MTSTSLREALRRLLALIPTLFLVSVVALWGLSHAFAPKTSAGLGRALPLFLNRTPRGVDERARALADTIVSEPGSSGAGSQLVTLGAAALPSLMPYLDSLTPKERARVAFALVPLAKRMGIADNDEFDTPEDAAASWNHYWTDHFIDYRPQVVERAVSRLAQRPSGLRLSEVRRLDTYALGSLMAAIETNHDPLSLSVLIAAAAEMTGETWHLETDASAAQRAQAVRECKAWWSLERPKFESYQGSRRMIAMLQDTQYGRWIMGLMAGNISDRNSTQQAQWSIAPTLALIAAGIVGGYFAGPALAAWSAVATAGRFIALSFSLFLACLPAAAVADWMHSAGIASRMWALLAMGFLGAGLLCVYQYQATRDALSFEFVRTHRAFGASPLRAALGALRSSSVVSAAHLANNGPALFAAACVMEWRFDWHGLGWLALKAVRAGDVDTLVWIATLGTALSGLLQIMSGLLLSRFDRIAQGES
ncbi:MAG TPA: ABC transporter permease subunit [Polyangiaceae bacterium]|nr:ABC transporter permease subunit [Polyangiaceae bacterium]